MDYEMLNEEAKKFFREQGAIGGAKVRGKKKRCSAAHYRRMVEIRKANAAKRKGAA